LAPARLSVVSEVFEQGQDHKREVEIQDAEGIRVEEVLISLGTDKEKGAQIRDVPNWKRHKCDFRESQLDPAQMKGFGSTAKAAA